MSEAFPRGSSRPMVASTGRPLVVQDSLFGNKRTKRIEVVDKTSKRQRTDKDSTSATPAPGLLAIGLGMAKLTSVTNKIARIEPMTPARCTPGSLAFGYILQVLENKLIVSLPGGAVGSVALHEVSDLLYQRINANTGFEIPALSSLCKPMQPVKCCVLSNSEAQPGRSGRKQIVLSMRSSLINRGLAMKHFLTGFPISGCVSSIEDHGYVVSCGVNAVNCFLPIKAVPSSMGTLIIGQPIDCVAVEVNVVARTVTLRAHPKAVRESVTRGSELTFNSLHPGMLLHVTVDKQVENGYIVKYLGLFHGVLDSNSLSRPPFAPAPAAAAGSATAAQRNSPAHAEQPLTAGDVAQARVVFVDHATKSVRLSMRPHVLEMRAPANLPPLGSVLEDLPVGSVVSRVGVLLDGSSSVAAAALDQEEEQPRTKISADAKKQSKKEMLAEQLAKKRRADEAVLGIFIPVSSLAKITLRGEGDDSNASAAVASGSASTGTKKGKKVSKSSNSRGSKDTGGDFDPETSKFHIHAECVERDRIGDSYAVGEKIPCPVRIMGHNLVEGWAIASNMPDFVKGAIVHSSHVAVGQLVNVVITAVKEYGLLVSINGRRNVRALCPLFHCGDFSGGGAMDVSSAVLKLAKRFKVGQKLMMRVWEVRPEDGYIIVTHKKSIVDMKAPVSSSSSVSVGDGAESVHSALTAQSTIAGVPTTPEEVSPGMTMLGIISSITQMDGLTLRFFNKMRGSVPMHVLTKQGVLDPLEAYSVGQVIRVCVLAKTLGRVHLTGSSSGSIHALPSFVDAPLAGAGVVVGDLSDAQSVGSKATIVTGTTAGGASKTTTGTRKKEIFVLALDVGSKAQLRQLMEEVAADLRVLGSVGSIDGALKVKGAKEGTEGKVRSKREKKERSSGGNTQTDSDSDSDSDRGAENAVEVIKEGVEEGEEDEEDEADLMGAGFLPREFVSGVIFKDNGEDSFMVRLDDGRLGSMHRHHFYDLASTADAVFASGCPFKKGFRVENALILAKTTKNVLQLTLKPLLIYAALSAHSTHAASGASVENGDQVSTEVAANTGGTAGVVGNLLSVLDAVHVPRRVTDMIPGQIVAGYIVQVENYGVIVRFRDFLSALCPRPNIADKFVASPIGLFRVGDSIRCAVQRVDLSRERAIVTFKASIVTPSSTMSICLPEPVAAEQLMQAQTQDDIEAEIGGEKVDVEGKLSNAQVVRSLIRPCDYLTVVQREAHVASVSALLSSKKIMPAWERYPLGSVVTATVSSKEGYGLVLLAEDRTTMMLARSEAKHDCRQGAEENNNRSAEEPTKKKKKKGPSNGGEDALLTADVAVGSVVRVCVLDIDYESSVLDVTLNNALIEGLEAAAKAEAAAAAQSKVGDDAKKLVKGSMKSKKVSAVDSASQNTSNVKVGEVTSAKVELVKKDYLVVSLLLQQNAQPYSIAHVLLSDFNSPFAGKDSAGEYQPGQLLQVKVFTVGSSSSTHMPSTLSPALPAASSASSSLSSSTLELVAPLHYPHAALTKCVLFQNEQRGLNRREQTARLQKDAEESDSRSLLRQRGGREDKDNRGENNPHAKRLAFVERLKAGQLISWRISSISPTEVELVPPLYVFPPLHGASDQDLAACGATRGVQSVKGVMSLSGAINPYITTDNLAGHLARAEKKVASATPSEKKVAALLADKVLPAGHPFAGLKEGALIRCYVHSVLVRNGAHVVDGDVAAAGGKKRTRAPLESGKELGFEMDSYEVQLSRRIKLSGKALSMGKIALRKLHGGGKGKGKGNGKRKVEVSAEDASEDSSNSDDGGDDSDDESQESEKEEENEEEEELGGTTEEEEETEHESESEEDEGEDAKNSKSAKRSTANLQQQEQQQQQHERKNPLEHLPFRRFVQAHGKGAIKVGAVYPVVVSDVSCSKSSISSSNGVGFRPKGNPYGVTVALSPYLSAPLNFVDVSIDLRTMQLFQKHCFVGQRLLVAVTHICRASKTHIRSIRVSRAVVEECQSASWTGAIPRPPDASKNPGDWLAVQKAERHRLTQNLAAYGKSYPGVFSSVDPIAEADEKEEKEPQVGFFELAAGALVPAMILLHPPSATASNSPSSSMSLLRAPMPPAFSAMLPHTQYARVCATEWADISEWQDMRAVFSATVSTSSSNNNNGSSSKNGKSKSKKSSKHSNGGGDDGVLTLPDGTKHGDIVICRVLPSLGAGGRAVGRDSRQQRDRAATGRCVEISHRPSRQERVEEAMDGEKSSVAFTAAAWAAAATAAVAGSKIEAEKESFSAASVESSIAADPLPAEGDVVRGYVATASTRGVFLRLSRELTGQVLMKDLADEYVEDPAKAYPVGALLKARVLSLNPLLHSASLSLKPSVVTGVTDESAGAAAKLARLSASSRKLLNALSAGAFVTGVVQRVVEPTGVFVAIQSIEAGQGGLGSKTKSALKARSGGSATGAGKRQQQQNTGLLVGLSRKIAAVADINRSLTDVFAEGDVVRAKVLTVSATTGKVALGLKEQYFRGKPAPVVTNSSDEEEEASDSDVSSGSGSESESESESGSDSEEDEEDGFVDAEGTSSGQKIQVSRGVRLLASRKAKKASAGSGSEEEKEDEDEEEMELDQLVKAAALPYSESESDGESDSDSDASPTLKDQQEEDEEEDSEEEGGEGEDEEEEKAGKASKKINGASKASVSSSTAHDAASLLFGDDGGDAAPPSSSSSSSRGKQGKHGPARGSDSDSESDSESENESGRDLDTRGGKEAGKEGKKVKHSAAAAGGGGGGGAMSARVQEKARTEDDIRRREAQLAEGTLVPQKSSDFERLLLAEPNSSYLWVQYMAFHLQQQQQQVQSSTKPSDKGKAGRGRKTEVDGEGSAAGAAGGLEAARAVAERALRTIVFREEEEKYNVWMAYVNMEYKFGSADSLEKVFTRAVGESKAKWIFLNFAETCEQAGDTEKAEALFARALKRAQLKKSKKVWLAFLQFKLRADGEQQAKAQLARAMQSLSRHKHVELISKYALAEFDFGSADRARVLLEELLSSYPKRTDLWHLYVDKETKLGNVLEARHLFERMIAARGGGSGSGSASARNMKAVFKKYLAFEALHGNAASVDAVKQKARDYVQSIA